MEQIKSCLFLLGKNENNNNNNNKESFVDIFVLELTGYVSNFKLTMYVLIV